MTENSKTKDRDEDVFRYVSSEMSVEQELRFEERLAHDQNLREQVASMVCTLAATDKVFAETTVSPAKRDRPTVKRSIIKIVTSLAAMILLATLAISMIADSQSSDESESLAAAWAESLDSDEFEIFDFSDGLEILPVSFESDSDWIYDVVDATHDDAAI